MSNTELDQNPLDALQNDTRQRTDLLTAYTSVRRVYNRATNINP